ncbi:hypothetical protein MNBD_GAMMA12-1547, partial [hydrothermal vent metagenome]
DRDVRFVTDLYGGEGYPNLAETDDKMTSLFIIDRLLFSRQSRYGNIWRNILKLLVTPLQVYKIRKIYISNCAKIVHAHPMYYMFLCWLARIPYVGTPQGDEMLIRPIKSKLYKYFASKVLIAAKAVIVDSHQMKDAIKSISGVTAHVIQNGIDVKKILARRDSKVERERITSIRGMEKLYRINEILKARRYVNEAQQFTFIYPFYDVGYLPGIRGNLEVQDCDLGRLEKNDMYKILQESILVISIPSSDSSPRSVYESIFSGCCVAVTSNPWINMLPECMRDRIFIVNLENKNWLADALEYATRIIKEDFIPSEKALNLFDESRSLCKVVDLYY